MSKEVNKKKCAVVLPEKRITDYIYDDVFQTKNTLYGIQYDDKRILLIHAYDKETGRILFKKEKVKSYDFYIGSCLVIELMNGTFYVYFDSIKEIKGPYNYISCDCGFITVKSITSLLYGAYNIYGNPILPVKYKYISVMFDKLAEVGLQNGNVGLVNGEGKYILEPICLDIKNCFYGRLFKFYDKQKKAYGAIDKCGRTLLPCTYDNMEIDEENEVIYIQKDSLYGIYKHGKGVVFFPTFRSLEKNCEVIELIGLDDKTYGYIPKLDLLLPRRYYTYYENYLKYFDGYKWRKLKYEKK